MLPFSHTLRKAVWQWMSSLAIIARYRRPLPDSKKERINWIIQEWCACLYGLAAIVLVALQLIPYQALILWYCVSAIAFFLNALRTLAAHCYRNEGNASMGESEQLLDSVNVPGPVAAIWAPVGLRFHATHHLFMLMPYHRLGKAHRMLMKELPANSPYRETLRGTLFDALARLWRESGIARDGGTAIT
jgi:fatty acid desaturase